MYIVHLQPRGPRAAGFESQMVAYFETACLRYVTSAEIYLALLQTMQIIFRLLLVTVEQILN